MISAEQVARVHRALPFWLPLGLLPLLFLAATRGG